MGCSGEASPFISSNPSISGWVICASPLKNPILPYALYLNPGRRFFSIQEIPWNQTNCIVPVASLSVETSLFDFPSPRICKEPRDPATSIKSVSTDTSEMDEVWDL